MENSNKPLSGFLKLVSYILVAALASGLTFWLCLGQEGTLTSAGLWLPGVFQQQTQTQSKLEELEELITECFIGEADSVLMGDAAATAMVDSLGDRWSYYIPASEYAAYVEQMQNSYVGIGVTISVTDTGFQVQQVEPAGGAREAGIEPGDVIVAVEGQSAIELGLDAAKELIRGDEGSSVSLTYSRDGAEHTVSVMRKTIQVVVAQGQMLENGIGLVTIANFDDRCADETIAAIEELTEQGAKALIFDVRFNPGGYKHELVRVLDYLLPEGALFRSLSYTGEETVDESDAKCLELPMAVLVNGSSYSAAEFFAAALEEYDWALVAGEPTTGKGYFQNTFTLSDGSAVGLSVGKYFTPKGVSLAEEGGLVPSIQVEVDDETEAKIYAQMLEPAEDPQIQAAVEALLKVIG